MLTNLHISNIKNQTSWSGELSRVTLFSGPNRSGKSAAMDGARLALTNSSSVGLAVGKQALLKGDGVAIAAISGDSESEQPIAGSWKYDGKKRTHSLMCGGMEVKSVTGDCPVTVEEYWALTGEQRWSLVEMVVGSFSEQPPAPIDSLKSQLQALQATPAPDKYEGDSIAVLTQKIEANRQLIADQKSLRSKKDMGEQAVANHASEVERLRNNVTTAAAIHDKALTHMDWTTNACDRCESAIDKWLNEPEYHLTGLGSNLKDIIENIRVNALEKLRAAKEIADEAFILIEDEDGLSSELDTLCNKLDDFYFHKELPEIPVSKSPSELKVLEALKGLGAGFSATSPTNARAFASKARGEAHDAVTRAQTQLLASEALYNKAVLEVVTVEHVTLCSDEELLAATVELATLQAQLDKANTYSRWLAGMDKRNAEITKLTEAIAASAQATIEYQARRAAYLDAAKSKVSDTANVLLSDMGLSPVEIEIGATGKRSTLTANAGGVDVLAMSGAERLMYGVALLHAFQEMSGAPCPVMFIEAAELDDAMLSKFLDSMATHRSVGNVFVGHWSQPEIYPTSISNHVFGVEVTC